MACFIPGLEDAETCSFPGLAGVLVYYTGRADCRSPSSAQISARTSPKVSALEMGSMLGRQGLQLHWAAAAGA